VINIGTNTHLIGTQALNIINNIFQNEDIWMALLPSLEKNANGDLTYHKI
jgi:hypothetical protein